MFSQTSEYALRIVVYLASLEGEPATTHEAAIATRVPEGYLSKVLQSLSRAGLVRSQRGLHGGSTLMKPAEEISVYDVIQAVDPIKRIETCPLGIKSHGVNLCPLHRRLDQSLELVEKALRESTMADLIAERGGSTPLCEIPAAEAVPVAVTVSGKKSRR